MKRLTLWQLMKGVTIAALIACTLAPMLQEIDAILANPGMFIALMVVVLLIQAPFFLLPQFIDWILGNKPNDNSKVSDES